MKKCKRILSYFLVMLMILQSTMITAFADTVDVSSGSNAGNTDTSFVASAEMLGGGLVVIIPDEIPLTYEDSVQAYTNDSSVIAKGYVDVGKYLEVSVLTDVTYTHDILSIITADGTVTFGNTDGAYQITEWSQTELKTKDDSNTVVGVTKPLNVSVPKANIVDIGTYSSVIDFYINLVADNLDDTVDEDTVTMPVSKVYSPFSNPVDTLNLSTEDFNYVISLGAPVTTSEVAVLGTNSGLVYNDAQSTISIDSLANASGSITNNVYEVAVYGYIYDRTGDGALVLSEDEDALVSTEGRNTVRLLKADAGISGDGTTIETVYIHSEIGLSFGSWDTGYSKVKDWSTFGSELITIISSGNYGTYDLYTVVYNYYDSSNTKKCAAYNFILEGQESTSIFNFDNEENISSQVSLKFTNEGSLNSINLSVADSKALLNELNFDSFDGNIAVIDETSGIYVDKNNSLINTFAGDTGTALNNIYGIELYGISVSRNDEGNLEFDPGWHTYCSTVCNVNTSDYSVSDVNIWDSLVKFEGETIFNYPNFASDLMSDKGNYDYYGNDIFYLKYAYVDEDGNYGIAGKLFMFESQVEDSPFNIIE